MKKKTGIIVLFSGGQDSTTCLGWAKNRYKKVIALLFNYKQKNLLEIKSAKKICSKLKIPLYFYNLSILKNITKNIEYYVPNRNLLFLVLAYNFALKNNIENIVTGITEMGYSNFPDCKNSYINKIKKLLNIKGQKNIKIHTPLIFLTKEKIFEMSKKEKILDIVLNYTYTCWKNSNVSNIWGKGCGKCKACLARKNGYIKYIKDIKNENISSRI